MLSITLFKKAVWLKIAFLVSLFLPLSITPYDTVNAAQRESCFSQHLCFSTIETNKSVKLLVRNDFDIAIRASVHMKGRNISPREALNNIPLRPGETKEAFIIRAQPGKTWQYTWTSSFHPGLDEASHDNDVLYDLPYSPKATYPISQGPNGSFSHDGINNNAIDWAMPVGTEIRAAREGIIVGYREDSNRGGSSAKYKSEHNYIWVEHSDGTIGQYLHLKENGVLVDIGDQVNRGQIIGLSGNTGYSTVPHLHFHVSGSQVEGDAYRTFPIKFKKKKLP